MMLLTRTTGCRIGLIPGGEEFSANEWDRCQPNIVRNLDKQSVGKPLPSKDYSAKRFYIYSVDGTNYEVPQSETSPTSQSHPFCVGIFYHFSRKRQQ